MKKHFLVGLLIICFLPAVQSQRQLRFAQYFANRTLRVDYWRIGCRQSDTLQLSRYVAKHGLWAGSQRILLDPFDNGDYRVEVREPSSGAVLYSRGYNTLFREYRDTKPGFDSVAQFEEVVLVPWPLRPVDIVFLRRDSLNQMHDQACFHFNPGDSSSYQELPDGLSPVTMRLSGPSTSKLDVVIVPEGYGPADRRKLLRDQRMFTDYLFSQEPFTSRIGDINVWSLNAYGEESGITNPSRNKYIRSAVGATFYTFGSDRYLMTFRLFQLHDLLDQIPYDQILIMANSDIYGGGAIYNFYAVSSMHEMAHYILPHELGHSIGGLADEYVDDELSYNEMHKLNVEPVEPNITTLVDFSSKWARQLPKGTPIPTPANDQVQPKSNGPLGVYEGAGYLRKGIYRPVMHCMMRDYAPFCPVCSQRLNAVIDAYCK